MAQLMPLPLTVSCFSKIQIGFTFLVQAHPGSAGQRALKWVCGVWVCLIQSVSRRTLGRPVHCLNASIIQSVTLAGGELRRRRGLPGHLLRNHTHYLYIGGFKRGGKVAVMAFRVLRGLAPSINRPPSKSSVLKVPLEVRPSSSSFFIDPAPRRCSRSSSTSWLTFSIDSPPTRCPSTSSAISTSG